jgi:hypothetical protein
MREPQSSSGSSTILERVEIESAFRRLLQRELEKHGIATRAGEGAYALALDQQLEPTAALKSLKQLETEALFSASSSAAQRLFVENETLEVLTRERVLARRETPKEPALELARLGSLEALRRVSGRNLQIALQRARGKEAKVLIQAWNLLPLYEQERTV